MNQRKCIRLKMMEKQMISFLAATSATAENQNALNCKCQNLFSNVASWNESDERLQQLNHFLCNHIKIQLLPVL